MGDNTKKSSNFIQNVFDEISLESNMELWMSSDDNLLQDRLEFLSSYGQSMFQDQLFDPSKRTNLAKNEMLSKGFLSKAEIMKEKEDFKQALHLFNMSLLLAPAGQESEILLKRGEVMDKLDILINVETNEKSSSSILGFQDCVDIQESKLQGRFTIANRDIKAGELIAIDQPVVKYLDKEYAKFHCWHCLISTQNVAMVPCSTCSGVAFCSEQCRNEAVKSYHR